MIIKIAIEIIGSIMAFSSYPLIVFCVYSDHIVVLFIVHKLEGSAYKRR